MGTQGSGALKPYLVDHTILTLKGHSKPSPADILGEDLEEGDLGGSSFCISSPPHPCLHLPLPSLSSRPPSQISLYGLFHSLLPLNLPFNTPTSYSSN